MVARDLTKLSRTVAHALRHRPWIYELELDDEGWVATADLLEALREKRGEWRDLTERGITLYQGNEKVWLADAIPAEFIVLPDSVP